jgi:uncharacterized SAM-binding protein YcdF (DUF218 family)
MSLRSDQSQGAPRPPDIDAVIIIFGAAVRPDGTPSPTLRYRVDAAARFGRNFRKPLFVPTGAKGRYGDAEALVMADQLRALGYVSDAIQVETSGTDTLSSVRACRRMLHDLDAIPVYACTSAYHLPRCLLLLRLAGLKARVCPPPPVPAATSRCLRWFWRFREAPALPYDAFLLLCLRATRRV